MSIFQNFQRIASCTHFWNFKKAASYFWNLIFPKKRKKKKQQNFFFHFPIFFFLSCNWNVTNYFCVEQLYSRKILDSSWGWGCCDSAPHLTIHLFQNSKKYEKSFLPVLQEMSTSWAPLQNKNKPIFDFHTITKSHLWAICLCSLIFYSSGKRLLDHNKEMKYFWAN